MKKSLIILVLLLTTNIFADETSEIMNKCNRLLEKQQYKSAFTILQDAQDQNSEILAKQVDILINYFVTSMMQR